MKVQPVPQQPLFRDRLEQPVRPAAWPGAALAAALATLFILLLRSLGA